MTSPPPARALVIIDAQNEFLSPDGNFPCPDESTAPLLRNLRALVPRFRAAGGRVIWVQALYLDRAEEPEAMRRHPRGTDAWLTSATHVYHVPCCAPGSPGAEIHADLLAVADPDRDLFVRKDAYSALQSSGGAGTLADALLGLSVGLGQGGGDNNNKNNNNNIIMTDAYFCGVASGTCVLATVLDAAGARFRDRFRTHVVTDCLGYRRLNNHEEALGRLARLDNVDLDVSSQIGWLNEKVGEEETRGA
ncbi:Isochorismatase-like protein [Xylariomycetidae sp. FL2044]|nr:Isochorismatase-like protein [Xylariomycetidae sp. FL2044]